MKTHEENLHFFSTQQPLPDTNVEIRKSDNYTKNSE